MSVTLLWFSAPWCAPCKRLRHTLSRVQETFAEGVLVKEVDITVDPDTTVNHRITAVPTVLFIDRAEIVDSLLGAHPESAYVDRIDAIVKGWTA